LVDLSERNLRERSVLERDDRLRSLHDVWRAGEDESSVLQLDDVGGEGRGDEQEGKNREGRGKPTLTTAAGSAEVVSFGSSRHPGTAISCRHADPVLRDPCPASGPAADRSA
jgi:hypothetical protein